jgi:hypothetical protein
MVVKSAAAQDTPAKEEQSLPLRESASRDEKHAKQAEIIEDSTVKVYVISAMGVGVEEGRVPTKVQHDEGDQSRHLSGSKFIFLFLWVYHRSTAQPIDPVYPSEAYFSLFFLVR